MSRSAFFTQMLADALGRPVEAVEVSESTALGAAVCAGVGSGVFSDAANKAIENAKAKIFQPDWLRVLEPDEIADSIRRIT